MMSATTLKAKKTKSAIPNPLNSLPWNVKKAQQREARNLRIESANLHRQLGIADDATFEEISEVTAQLIAKAEAEGRGEKQCQPKPMIREDMHHNKTLLAKVIALHIIR